MMYNSVLEQYKTCDGIVRILLQYTPVWAETRFQRYLKTFLPCYASVFGTVVSYIVFSGALNSSDMSALTEFLVPAVALITIPFKMMPTIIYTDLYVEIYGQLDKDMRLYCNEKATITLQETTLKMFGGSMKFLFICSRMILLNYIFVPLIIILYQIIANVRPVKLILPYPGSYPDIIMDDIIIFTVVYLFEALNVLVGACTALGTDCFFGLAIFQITTILNILSNKVQKADCNDELFGALQECIDKHCQLKDISHQLERIYALMFLSQRLTDAIVLCAVIYQMHLIADLDMSKFLLCGSWIIVKFMQQLTYGWYGSLLISESENLNTTIYSCKWPDFYNKRFMTNVAHVLQQKPIAINVYGFFVISIPMASSVITASVSYFFLLQSLE